MELIKMKTVILKIEITTVSNWKVFFFCEVTCYKTFTDQNNSSFSFKLCLSRTIFILSSSWLH